MDFLFVAGYIQTKLLDIMIIDDFLLDEIQIDDPSYKCLLFILAYALQYTQKFKMACHVCYFLPVSISNIHSDWALDAPSIER